MRLRFVGQDRSMGLHFGLIYRLKIEPFGDGILITAPVQCPYESDAAFWRNWALPTDDNPSVKALREEARAREPLRWPEPGKSTR